MFTVTVCVAGMVSMILGSTATVGGTVLTGVTDIITHGVMVDGMTHIGIMAGMTGTAGMTHGMILGIMAAGTDIIVGMAIMEGTVTPLFTEVEVTQAEDIAQTSEADTLIWEAVPMVAMRLEMDVLIGRV